MKKSFRCFLASLLAPLLLLSGCARAEYLPLFPLVRPAFAGEQEMIFHIGGDEYRKLQVALFSEAENLLRKAAARQDQLLLDLTRPLRPGECLTLFAGGQTAEGEEFSWQRDYHVSSLGAGCWQAEALLSRLRKLGGTAAARPARFPRSLTSLGDLSLFDFAAPEVLRSESPDGSGPIRIPGDAGDWDIVYLQEPGLSLSSMLWDAEREAYTAVSESFDFQAAHELSVSQQLPLDGKPTL